jgi:hypothetical protein
VRPRGCKQRQQRCRDDAVRPPVSEGPIAHADGPLQRTISL